MGLIALLLACDGEPVASSGKVVNPTPPYAPPAGFDTLRVALTPYLDAQLLLQQREPFRAWLSDKLGVRVEMRVAASYDEMGDLLARGEVDMGEMSPYGWVRTHERLPELVPLVSKIANGSTSAAGYIVVRTDSDIRTIEDLRGRSLAFVDPASTTGYLFPELMLQEHVITPAKVDFLGDHDAVLLAVHDGRYDAGAVYQGAMAALEQRWHIDPLEFRVIAKTPRIPQDLWCSRPEVPAVVRDQLVRLLLGITVRSPDGRRVLGPMGVNGFMRVDAAAYDPIREAAKKIGAL